MNTEFIGAKPQEVAANIINNLKNPDVVVHYEPIYRDMLTKTRGGTYHLLTQQGNHVKQIAAIERTVTFSDVYNTNVFSVKYNPYITLWTYTEMCDATESPLNTFNARIASKNDYDCQIMRWLNRKLQWQHNNGRTHLAHDLFCWMRGCTR